MTKRRGYLELLARRARSPASTLEPPRGLGVAVSESAGATPPTLAAVNDDRGPPQTKPVVEASEPAPISLAPPRETPRRARALPTERMAVSDRPPLDAAPAANPLARLETLADAASTWSLQPPITHDVTPQTSHPPEARASATLEPPPLPPRQPATALAQEVANAQEGLAGWRQAAVLPKASSAVTALHAGLSAAFAWVSSPEPRERPLAPRRAAPAEPERGSKGNLRAATPQRLARQPERTLHIGTLEVRVESSRPKPVPELVERKQPEPPPSQAAQ